MTQLYKEEYNKHPPRGGWAPGSYTSVCTKCSYEFLGAKRSVTCHECAYIYEHANTNLSELVQYHLDGILQLENTHKRQEILNHIASEIVLRELIIRELAEKAKELVDSVSSINTPKQGTPT